MAPDELFDRVAPLVAGLPPETVLRLAEEAFPQLAEDFRDVYYVNDPELRQVLYVSRGYEITWGRSRESLYAAPGSWLESVLPEDRPRVERALGAARRAERGYEMEYRVVRPDGEVRWIRARGFPVRGADGGISRNVGVAEDVTERRRAEEEREAALAERDRFYSTMSHELRTPISAIMLYNDLLLSGVYGPLTDAQAEGIQRSQKSAGHLLELVNEVLDLSRLAAGKMEIHPEEVPLAEFLRGVLSEVRPLAEEHGCELVLDVEHAPAVVVTDPRRLRQVLLNLLSNAVKFGSGHPVHLVAEGGPEGVRIGVADQGPGIVPEDLPRIFEEFVQLGDESEGTGLGLSISRRLAAALGGRLEVDSTPGAGSTFRVVLAPVG